MRSVPSGIGRIFRFDARNGARGRKAHEPRRRRSAVMESAAATTERRATYASFPWYDLPEIGAANDALWEALRAKLTRGCERVPKRLDRPREHGIDSAGTWPRSLRRSRCVRISRIARCERDASQFHRRARRRGSAFVSPRSRATDDSSRAPRRSVVIWQAPQPLPRETRMPRRSIA